MVPWIGLWSRIAAFPRYSCVFFHFFSFRFIDSKNRCETSSICQKCQEQIMSMAYHSYPFLASGDQPLLITFANSLDPDQGQQNVGPDPDPNHLTL